MPLWLLPALEFLKALFGLGQAVVGEVHDTQERAAGQAEQKAADQDDVIAAQQRIETAEKGPHDDKTTSDLLSGGRF